MARRPEGLHRHCWLTLLPVPPLVACVVYACSQDLGELLRPRGGASEASGLFFLPVEEEVNERNEVPQLAPSKLEAPRELQLPNHVQVQPQSWFHMPEDFRDVPLLPDSVWEASLAESAEDYPLLQGMLQRLHRNETVRIQVYGGSMTFGQNCTATIVKQECSWPTQVLARLRQTFPGANISLDHRARGGCDGLCGLPDMAMTLSGGHESYDLVMLDYGQNGLGHFGVRPEVLEDMVRVFHFFLPNTLVLLIYNRDMEKVPDQRRDLQIWEDYKAVSKHYGLPLFNYVAAMEKWTSLGGDGLLMWSRRDGYNLTHHPKFATHAYFADMVTYLCNRELQKLPRAAVPAPVLRKPMDLQPDQEWIAPYHPQAKLAEIEACLFVRSQHVAREPGPSPRQSAQGHWQLYEDRPSKPGWITQTRNSEVISFHLNFSKSPKLMVQYLRSYSNMGTAEVLFDRGTWKLRRSQQPKGRNFKILGAWTEKVSVTQNALFVAEEGQELPSSALVSFRLVSGAKFKIIALISC